MEDDIDLDNLPDIGTGVRTGDVHVLSKGNTPAGVYLSPVVAFTHTANVGLGGHHLLVRPWCLKQPMCLCVALQLSVNGVVHCTAVNCIVQACGSRQLTAFACCPAALSPRPSCAKGQQVFHHQPGPSWAGPRFVPDGRDGSMPRIPGSYARENRISWTHADQCASWV